MLNRSLHRLLVGFLVVFGLIATTMLFSSLIIADNIDKKVAFDEQIRVKSSLRQLAEKEANQVFAAVADRAIQGTKKDEIAANLSHYGFLDTQIFFPKALSQLSHDNKATERSPFIHTLNSALPQARPTAAKVSGHYMVETAQLWLIIEQQSQNQTIIAKRALSQMDFNSLANELRLKKLMLVTEKTKSEENGYLDLAGPDNSSGLEWTSLRPGHEFTQMSLPYLFACAFIIVCFVIIVLNRLYNAESNIRASDALARHMATHDIHTNLPNRALMLERYQQARDRNRRKGGHMAVLCLGIDRYREIIEAYGHDHAQEFMIQIGEKINKLMRSHEHLGRMDSDTFLLILPEAEALETATMSQRLIDQLQGMIEVAHLQIYCSPSIGITVVTDPNCDSDEAFRQAQVALYQSQEKGKAQYMFYDTEIDSSLRHRKQMEAELRKTLIQTGIGIMYQPQVDDQGRIVGLEALARWNHPERGFIPPNFFIPLAEDCGLMGELGFGLMKKAFQDAKQWPQLKMAVNVSVMQLRDKNFLDQVCQSIKDAQISTSQIEIEITESLLLEDDVQTQNTLAQLRAKGFSIALDDFGTGYSSLSYLNRYPIDKLKIDRAFIDKLGKSEGSTELLETLIQLARRLRLDVIAEGVETQEQVTTLKKIGCYHYQGFGFSRPIPAEQINELILASQYLYIKAA